MKIAIFTDTFVPEVNGVVFVVDTLANKLSAKHSVVIYAPQYNGEEAVVISNNLTIERYTSIPLFAHKTSRIALPNLIRLYKSVRKFDPDIIHVHTPGSLGAAGIVVAKQLDKPLMGTFHTLVSELLVYISPKKLVQNILPSLPSIKYDFILRRLPETGKYFKKYKKYMPRGSESFKKLTWKALISIYARCDLVSVPSHTVLKEIKRRGLKRPSVFIPNPIDVKRKFKAKTNYKLNEQILYVGRLGLEKKIDKVVKAFEHINKLLPETKLIIVGGGPAEEGLHKQVKSLNLNDRVVFTGMIPRDELVKIYRQSDLFITASTMEVQPLVVLEAAATGLPIIGVKSYGLLDLVKDGYNGYLAKPDKPKYLAELAVKVLKDSKLRERMGKNSRKLAEEFDTDKTATTILETYKTLALKKRKPKKSVVLFT